MIIKSKALIEIITRLTRAEDSVNALEIKAKADEETIAKLTESVRILTEKTDKKGVEDNTRTHTKTAEEIMHEWMNGVPDANGKVRYE